jgi:prepilin-type N-terminal cleavage/methylation domain-containing protein
MKHKGFTLIELLVVISIISLISSVVLSSLAAARERAKVGAGRRYATQFARALAGNAAGIWFMNEGAGTTVADYSNNGGTATFNGSPTWSSDTISGSGNSLSFNGSNTYLTGSMPAGAFSGDFTITAWFKRTAMTTWGAIYSNSVGTSDTPIMTMRNATNQFGIMRVGVTENEGVYVDLGTDMDGKWIFGVVQRQGTTLRVFAYKEGRLISNSGTLTWTLNSTNQFYIGRHYQGAVQVWNGLIDEVAVYSDALTFSQIDSLYAQGLEKTKFASVYDR